MKTQVTTPAPAKLRWYQYSLRHLFIAVALFSVVMSGYAWFQHAWVEPRAASRQIALTINSLQQKRPQNLTAKQWEVATFWTQTLTANCVLWHGTDLDKLRRFQHELEARTKGNVDMSTILWIWDQHAELTPRMENYIQRYRQVMLDEMQ